MKEMNFVKEPLISIIITYYNMGKYIKDLIESIKLQTYTNYEIIIVNDFSDKENSDILNEIKDVKIINQQENLGQLCALCEGLKEAQGEFVCMVDADDILLPDYLKILLYAHLNNNYALISSYRGEINARGEVLALNNKKEKISYKEIEILFRTHDHFRVKPVLAPYGLWSWNPSTSAMWRKSAVEILKYFPDKIYWRTGADKVLFSLLHLVGGSANIDTVLFLYRTHGANNFNSSYVSGNKKYLSEKTINKLIEWNIKLRKDTLKMFIENRKQLIEKFNKINYVKMILSVIFCVDLKICAKIIKTFAHKLIKF